MKQSHIEFIGRRLTYLVVIFVLCSCCEHKDTVNPIKKQDKGQVLDASSLGGETRIVQLDLLPGLVIGRMNFGFETTSNPPGKITLDIEEGADIQGDAWALDTIQKIKECDRYVGQFGSILFERIGVMPVYWGDYLRAFCAQPVNYFYKLPDNEASLVQSSYCAMTGRDRTQLLETYHKGFGFYHDLEKIPLSELQLPISYEVSGSAADPQLVTLTSIEKSLFQQRIPQLMEVLQQPPMPEENTVLKKYYELLLSGGLLIFMSSSSGLNRFGGIIIEYQGKKYTPFQDLDDPHLQAVYRNIFERAGFVDIQFYKDPYFREDVILLVAKKP